MPIRQRLLILGGTAEARTLAERLTARPEIDVITSLAGRTDNPILPDGKTRIGGFGGIEGLVGFLQEEGITTIVDATHPFACRISDHASKAAKDAGSRILHLERPAWTPQPDDNWHSVKSLSAGISLLPQGARVFVTIGRQQLDQFLPREDLMVIARTIEAPKITVPDHWTIILSRAPVTFADERALLDEHRIEWLFTKNAGSEETQAKLVAAREKKIPVIMVERLPGPPGKRYPTVDAVLEAIDFVGGPATR